MRKFKITKTSKKQEHQSIIPVPTCGVGLNRLELHQLLWFSKADVGCDCIVLIL